MNAPSKNHRYATALAIAALALTGCLRENPGTGPDTEVKVTSTNPHIAFLVEELGMSETEISVRLPDELRSDTSYIFAPKMSEEAKKRGVLSSGIGFSASVVSDLIKKNAEKQALKRDEQDAKKNAKDDAKDMKLAKSSHTRWVHWTSLVDVKYLNEVHNVRIYIKTTGGDRLGPNWQAAIRGAISNWGSQATGTSVSFLETTDLNAADIVFRGAFGLGPQGTMTNVLYINPTPYVDKIAQYGGVNAHAVDVVFNIGFEHNGIPYNQKATIAMSSMALITNISYTGAEGLYWNFGDATHVPGTPYTDGDSWTPGSSILTPQTGNTSTPALTASDLKVLRTLYPSQGLASKLTYNTLITVGEDGGGSTTISTNVNTFQQEGDTIIFLRNDGNLYRRVGIYGSNVQLWPAYGSSGAVTKFVHSNGYVAVQNTSGWLYAKTPTGNWVFQSNANPIKFKLAGERLLLQYVSANAIYSKWLTSNPGSWVNEWGGSNIQDFDVRVENQRLAVADNGSLYAKDGYNPWVALQYSSEGFVKHVYLSSTHVVSYAKRIGISYDEIRARAGLYGSWGDYLGYVTDPNHVDVCDDKVAMIHFGYYLYLKDLSSGDVYYQPDLPGGQYTTSVRLSGANCDYITRIDPWGVLRAKYGMDHNTDYVTYWSNTASLWQRQGRD